MLDTSTAQQTIDDLQAAFALDDADHQEQLHDVLVEQAAAEELLDVAYRTLDTRFGPLLLAATPAGLVRVAFEREGHDVVLEQLASQVSPRLLRAPARLDLAAHQIDAYFRGERRAFELPLDLQLSRGFRRNVLEHLRTIPYGTTESYAEAAGAAGRPAAVRAAASACSHNPLPIVVPCHRVVRSDGTLGQYLDGPETKRALLALEEAA